MRVKVTMACEACKDRNYMTTKNRTKTPDRLTKTKFCPKCNAHKLHKETK